MLSPYLLLALVIGWGASVGGAYFKGASVEREKHVAQATKDALERSEANRETERLAGRNNTRIADELTRQSRIAVAGALARADRLRNLSDAARAADPSLATCGRDAPAAAVLRGEDRGDLVALAEEADDTARALAACQRYIVEVVKPGD